MAQKNRQLSQAQEQNLMRRPTIYMAPELETELEDQATTEKTSKSRVVTDLLNLVLLSQTGRRLRRSAKQNQRTLAEELENYLFAFLEDFPTERVAQLAKESQRTSTQMSVHLVLLGLKVYDRYLSRLQEVLDEEA